MKTTNSFKKNIAKEIRKTDLYKLKKREIGKIRSLSFTYMDTHVLRSNPVEYCEYTDFIIKINNGIATLFLRIFTDGSINLYE